MLACIICLAVLSGLLNLMRGATSEIDADASFEADSTEFPTVVMHLLEKGGNTAARLSNCREWHLSNINAEGKPLLDIVDFSVWLVFVW